VDALANEQQEVQESEKEEQVMAGSGMMGVRGVQVVRNRKGKAVMAEAEAGKATATGLHHEIQCSECGAEMWVKRLDDGIGWFYQHSSLVDCPNAGKRFKVKTVELEEL